MRLAETKEAGDIMSRKKKAGCLGASFSGYLKSEGVYEEASTVAVKRVLAWQQEEAMCRDGMTKNKMANRMRTSRG